MLGIILLNYNTWEDTVNCIRSITEFTNNVNYRIYVVDNMSPNKISEEQLILFRKLGIVLIQNSENKGYAAGNNVGVKKALDDGCNQILISNTDVLYHKNSIVMLSKYLFENVKVGIVGPKIYNLNGNFQGVGRTRSTTLKEKYFINTPLRIFNKKDVREFYGRNLDNNLVQSVHDVSGCCFMMSRECAEAITPFDENTFLFQEEIIIGLKMLEKGFLTHYIPTSTVTHLEGQSTKDEMSAFSFTKFVLSEIYYCKNYLKADILQIIPLYIIRTFSYMQRGFNQSSYRKGVKNYLYSTFSAINAK